MTNKFRSTFLGTFLLLLISTNPLWSEGINYESNVPAHWSCKDGALSISDKHYRIGTESIDWSWIGGDQLTITNPPINAGDVNSFYKHTLSIWVYNEAPIDDTIRFKFYSPTGGLSYYFDFILNYEGWRRISRSYMYDMHKASGANGEIDKLIIKAPQSGNGHLFFDDWTYVTDRYYRVASRQMPDVSGYYAKTELLMLDNLVPDIPYQEASADELADLEKVRSYLIPYLASGGSKSYPGAVDYYNALNIVVDNNKIRGKMVSPYDTEGQYFQALAYHYFINKDPETLEMIVNFLWLMNDCGYAGGSDLTYGWYDTRDYFAGLSIVFDALPEWLKVKVYDAVSWTFHMKEYWHPNWNEKMDMSTDHIYTNFRFQLAAMVNGITDKNEAVRQMKGFTRLLNIMNNPSPGLREWLKPDGTGFHHEFHYNHYMYAYSRYADLLYALNGTQYQINKHAYEIFRDAMLGVNVQCNGGDYAVSLSGRYPFSQNTPLEKSSHKKLSYVGGDVYGTEVDEKIARSYNRIYGVDPDFSKFGTEEFPEGAWQFNYSPILVVRKEPWVTTIKGIDNVFVGAEIFSDENRYGRYMSYGAMEIIYKGGFNSSGLVRDGWNWNLFPGTTTKYLPWNMLVATKSRNDEYGATNFAGALRFNKVEGGIFDNQGELGMYGFDFAQKADITPSHDNSFKAKKSYFYFGDYFVCLGSDIQCNDINHPIVTTLFQCQLNPTSSNIYVDSSPINAFPYLNSLQGSHYIVDQLGNGFIVVSDSKIEISKQNQDSPSQTGSGTTNGNFSWAYIDHGNAPKEGEYEYVAMPGSTNDKVGLMAEKINANKPYTVIQKDAQAHIIRENNLQIEAYSLFKANSNLKNTVVKSNSYPCLIMLQGAINCKMTVVNPNLNFVTGYDGSIKKPIYITIRGQWKVNALDDGVSVIETTDSTTSFSINTIDGKAFDIDITASGISLLENIKINGATPADWDSTKTKLDVVLMNNEIPDIDAKAINSSDSVAIYLPEQLPGAASILVYNRHGIPTTYIVNLSAAGEFIEDFEKLEGIGMLDQFFTGNNNQIWYVNGRIGEYLGSGNSLYFYPDQGGVVSEPIAGGISSFSLEAINYRSTDLERFLEVYINDSLIAKVGSSNGEKFIVHAEGLNFYPNAVLKIINGTDSYLAIAIDNISWKGYAPDRNAYLREILLDGVPLDNFDPKIMNYTVESNTLPDIEATSQTSSALVEITTPQDTNGKVKIKVTAFDGSWSVYEIAFTQEVGIKRYSSGNLHIYPNPADNLINIELKNHSGTKDICIYAANGQLKHKLSIDNDFVQIDMSRFPKGIYIVKVQTGSQTSITRMIK